MLILRLMSILKAGKSEEIKLKPRGGNDEIKIKRMGVSDHFGDLGRCCRRYLST